jgi:polar amino acid transport system permease protein
VTREGPRLRVVVAGVLILLLVAVGCSGGRAGAYQYNWNILFDSVFRPNSRIINGLMLTVSIAVSSQIIGVILGVFGALGRLSRVLPFRWIANTYVWAFRGTPLLVQIMLLYYGLLNTGIYPWSDFTVLGWTLPGVIQAAIFALGVNEGAYMTEIVRAGILSVDPGQMEAAKSLGMTYGKAMRRIVLPQAARVIIPPLGNEFNNMLKTTSLLVILSVPELFVVFSQMNGNGATQFHPFELFIACAIWFLLLTSIWGLIQVRIERRFAKGAAGSGGSLSQPGLRARLFGFQNRPTGQVSGAR